MANWLSTILQTAGLIRNETQTEGNTKVRVASAIENIGYGAIYEYDPTLSYLTGQYCVYEGVLTRVEQDAAAGQTPVTHPLKYSQKIVRDITQITANNTLPVSAGALATYAPTGSVGPGGTVPNASTDVAGKARQASADVYKAGTSDATYVTPKQVKTDVNAINATLASLPFQYTLGRFVRVTNAPDFNKEFSNDDYLAQ